MGTIFGITLYLFDEWFQKLIHCKFIRLTLRLNFLVVHLGPPKMHITLRSEGSVTDITSPVLHVLKFFIYVFLGDKQ